MKENNSNDNHAMQKMGRAIKNTLVRAIMQIVLFGLLTIGGIKLTEILLSSRLFEPISIIEKLFGESTILNIISLVLSSLLGSEIVEKIIIIQSVILLIISLIFLLSTHKGIKNGKRIKRSHISLMISVMIIVLLLLTSGFGAFFGNGSMMFLSWLIPSIIFFIGLLELIISINGITGVRYYLNNVKTENEIEESRDE